MNESPPCLVSYIVEIHPGSFKLRSGMPFLDCRHISRVAVRNSYAYYTCITQACIEIM